VDVAALSVHAIPSGKYRYILTLMDTLGNEYARTDKQVFIYNPKIPQVPRNLLTAKGAELAGLSSDELADEFRKAQYIASTEDLRLFKKLTSADAMREYLAKFWSDFESKQQGGAVMTRTVYLDRIQTASQRYRVMGKEGWRSDRGRVFVLNAEPDDIQRFPSTENCKPYEIWSYNQIENGVQFVFIDMSGFGDYQLVHSTKRGELQDESWQRYLQ
jgi:GWxTD domain-containing protein